MSSNQTQQNGSWFIFDIQKFNYVKLNLRKLECKVIRPLLKKIKETNKKPYFISVFWKNNCLSESNIPIKVINILLSFTWFFLFFFSFFLYSWNYFCIKTFTHVLKARWNVQTSNLLESRSWSLSCTICYSYTKWEFKNQFRINVWLRLCMDMY